MAGAIVWRDGVPYVSVDGEDVPIAQELLDEARGTVSDAELMGYVRERWVPTLDRSGARTAARINAPELRALEERTG